MKKGYQILLYYGYEEGECGIYHSFQAEDPDLTADDDMIGEHLAGQLDLTADSDRFNYDSMYIDLPFSLIERIKQEAVQEYLAEHK